ncbi:uncharacterized protein K460DRAFT_366199 [Cucurbitaria berberidis CBS 394.84]|uniref:Uncharacterized protein n=1 Tax=Cucurbitaria berberidis CBS 394.84 TaxID=1168544 RepID=A0A9P4GHI8_9PLEO|nr:uncharacterized protein K460DRAFT_366199 [Cucurbitaria berberidis CBS 394.84]KAF1845321.1 hypothetical protein K460DRAFT_366199 [Cucurbitaria berberidis CBS 394.84]
MKQLFVGNDGEQTGPLDVCIYAMAPIQILCWAIYVYIVTLLPKRWKTSTSKAVAICIETTC